jgi:ubiquinone/menaquinone biosynthesis C-methylase UbiE
LNKLSEVKSFWESDSCGERYAVEENNLEAYERQKRIRYELEPWVQSFADFKSAKDLDALEIGVGMGADHEELALSGPRSLTGIDLTERSIFHVRNRFVKKNLHSNLQICDVESMNFPDASFDYVYSCGVIHHTPNTEASIKEIYRVLRPGGSAKIMIYHYWSPVGLMLWLRYALAVGRP